MHPIALILLYGKTTMVVVLRVNMHEYVLCFAKNISTVGKIELPPDEKVLKYYKYKDDKFETRGPYRLQPLATTSMDDRPNLKYPLYYHGHEVWPAKQWLWAKERSTRTGRTRFFGKEW